MPETTFDIDVIAAARPGVVALFDGEVVYAKGEPAECAYMVRRGRIELRGTGGAIGVVKAGEIFGETALLDGEPQVCSAVALGEAELMKIDRPLFRTLVRDDPEFAAAVMNLLARQLRGALAALERREPTLPLAPERPRLAPVGLA